MNNKNMFAKFLIDNVDNYSLIEYATDTFLSKGEMLPKDKNNYVGIEVECLSPLFKDDLAAIIIKNGLGRYIQIDEDGSIEEDAGSYGYEFKILVKESEIKKIFPKLKKFFKKAKLTVNTSCGLHVHLDMRNRNKKTCYNKLYAVQNLMYRLVKSDRWDNQYCEKNSKNIKNAVKYKAINASHRNKTIEVRLHHGSVNADEIEGWINFLLTVINSKSSVKETKVLKTKKLKPYFKKSLDIGGDYTEYLNNKAVETSDNYDTWSTDDNY